MCRKYDGHISAASDLSKSASTKLSRNPNIINTAADMLKKDVEKLENNCAIPIKNPEINFFIGDRYKWAKEDLEKVLKSEGKDINAKTCLNNIKNGEMRVTQKIVGEPDLLYIDEVGKCDYVRY